MRDLGISQNRRSFMKRSAALGAALGWGTRDSASSSPSGRQPVAETRHGEGRSSVSSSGAFIRTREATLAPTHRADPELNFEHWPMERIRLYVEMLKRFGFNSLQLMEVRGYVGGYRAANMSKLEDLQDRIVAIADHARGLGMRTSMFVWAQILLEQGKVYCPSDPQERAVIEKEHDRFARVYARHFDHVIAYWGEPGPCMKRCHKCDYATYQGLTTALLDRWRVHNPKAQASFNIWGLMIPERAGKLADKTGEILGRKAQPKAAPRLLERMVAYKEVLERLRAEGPIVDDQKRLAAMGRLVNADALGKGIGICLDGCTTGALTWSGPTPLYFDELEVIARAGRPAGVWGWYLVDMEGAERSDFEIQRVSEFFESFPKHLGAELAWHSVDMTDHGWPPIILNAWVAAQKMIDQARPADSIVGEFCEDYFGTGLAAAMKKAYLVLDKAPLVARLLPKVDVINLMGLKDYETMARDALNTLKSAASRRESMPGFPAIIPPGEMRDFAIARLEKTLSISRHLRELQT